MIGGSYPKQLPLAGRQRRTKPRRRSPARWPAVVGGKARPSVASMLTAHRPVPKPAGRARRCAGCNGEVAANCSMVCSLWRYPNAWQIASQRICSPDCVGSHAPNNPLRERNRSSPARLSRADICSADAGLAVAVLRQQPPQLLTSLATRQTICWLRAVWYCASDQRLQTDHRRRHAADGNCRHGVPFPAQRAGPRCVIRVVFDVDAPPSRAGAGELPHRPAPFLTLPPKARRCGNRVQR